jgi:hypothetical protein
MIERSASHPAGRFTRYRSCGKEPRHIRAHGRSISEPVSFTAAGTRHRLECACGARTALHTTITNAETEWGADYAQLALELRTPRRRRVAA